MDEKKVREAIAWMENERRIHKYGTHISPSIPKEQISKIGECYDLAIEALEKQLPKKLIEHHYEEPGETPYIKYGCGNGCKMQPSRSSKYCNQCGQRIDWSE
nr:MAG TPA: NADH-PPase NADH pyrophosphatase zinc ribbon domain [Caudoviricetes sp.]